MINNGQSECNILQHASESRPKHTRGITACPEISAKISTTENRYLLPFSTLFVESTIITYSNPSFHPLVHYSSESLCTSKYITFPLGRNTVRYNPNLKDADR